MSERFDNGLFRVLVPTGWALFHGIDSDCKVTPKKVHIVKDAARETDIFTHAGITVCFFDRQDTYLSPKFFYDDTADLEAFTLGSHTWNGYTCTGCGYPYTMLETDEDDCVFQVMILTKNGEHAIALRDADVQSILESLAVVR